MIHTELKNKVLHTLSEMLADNAQAIISANQKDLNSYSGGDEAMFDRLKVDETKVSGMVKAVEEAIELNDPVGKLLFSHKHENGMIIDCKTVPFGNIMIIYESRPDVTIEASVVAFKAGNKIFLKGGKEARNSNLILCDLWNRALEENQVHTNYINYLDKNREETQRIIRENTYNIDLIIPRGGEKLIEFTQQNSSAPVIVSGRGNNFMYVDQDADFEMAIEIAINGKSRISVCNALDKVLLHEKTEHLNEKLKILIDHLRQNNISIIGDEYIAALADDTSTIVSNSILDEEFLSPKILLKVVSNIDEAIGLINKHSGKHSAAIVSNSKESAETFMNGVDCAAVYHNASTRFTDGGQFGFGAEMAISTKKLHFRGPIGIDQLVTNKWFVHGEGQIRE